MTTTTRELIFEKIQELTEQKNNLKLTINKQTETTVEFDQFHAIEIDLINGNIKTLKETLFNNIHEFIN